MGQVFDQIANNLRWSFQLGRAFACSLRRKQAATTRPPRVLGPRPEILALSHLSRLSRLLASRLTPSTFATTVTGPRFSGSSPYDVVCCNSLLDYQAAMRDGSFGLEPVTRLSAQSRETASSSPGTYTNKPFLTRNAMMSYSCRPYLTPGLEPSWGLHPRYQTAMSDLLPHQIFLSLLMSQ